MPTSTRSVPRVVIPRTVALLGAAILLVGFASPVAAESTPRAPRAFVTLEEDHSDDESEAMDLAVELGEDVVVESATSEMQQVVAQPDGTFEITIDNVPVRVKQGGEWVSIDTNLVQSDDGTYFSPVATTVGTRFTAGGSNELAQVQLDDGSWLTETWPLGDLPPPVIDGADATYEDVLPDVDLQLTATSTGMSEVLIIKTEEAAENPDLDSIEIGIDGANVVAHEDGSLTATPEGEEPSESDLRSSAPTAWDSEFERGDANGPAPEDIPLEVQSETTEDSLTLDIDSLIDGEDLTYPVFVDPDWTGNRAAAWFINATYPDQTYPEGGAFTGGSQQVGYVQGSWSSDGKAQTARSFWRMDTSYIKGKTVSAAHFDVTEIYASSCNERVVNLYSTSAAAPGWTWNQSGGVSYGLPLDGKNVAYGYDSSCPATSFAFNAFPAVDNAAKNNLDYVTFALRAANELDTLSWKKFAYETHLVVTYNTTPDVPVGLRISAPPRSCGTSSSPVYIPGIVPSTFSAQLVDDDGGNLTGRFFIQKNTGGTYANALPGSLAPSGYLSSASQPSGYQSVVIPANTLSTGSYRWYVQGRDSLVSSASSGYCYFVVENDPPAAPVVQSRAPIPYIVGKSTTIELTSSSTDQADVYVYWWSEVGSSSPAPGLPVDPAIINVCDRAGSGKARYACTGLGSEFLTVAPVENASTLWVATRDAAGLRSVATPVPFFPGDETAVSDFAGFSGDVGHAWPTVGESGPLSRTLSDVNQTAAALDLDLGPTAVLGAQGTPQVGQSAHSVIELPGLLPLSEFLTGGKHAEFAGSPPEYGYVFDRLVGWILPPTTPQPAGTRTLYKCVAVDDDYLSNTSCGDGPLLGYTWASSPGGTPTPMCMSSTGSSDRTVITAATCPGTNLGWVKTDAIAEADGPAVNTTDSFTVSAWLKPAVSPSANAMTAISQAGPANSAFTLGRTASGHWQFCMQEQRAGSERICAVSNTAPSTNWEFVTGVWDEANDQIRIYEAASNEPSDVTWRPANTFSDTSAEGNLTVGSAVLKGAPAESWNGQISHPSIYPGVADVTLRAGLNAESAPY